jgi:hypothetical protein
MKKRVEASVGLSRVKCGRTGGALSERAIVVIREPIRGK